MNYLSIFNQAWINYQRSAERKHGLLGKNISNGIFAGLFNMNREIDSHPASGLSKTLANHPPEDAQLKESFIKFLLENPPENTNSFSSYLIDELMAHDTDGGWELFELEPVITFSEEDIPLYRGVKYDPDKALSSGLKQHYTSSYLDAYTSSQNGGVGNSTSLSYQIAFDYAAPKQENDPEVKKVMMYCKKLFGNSYVYVIHYRGHKGVHIPNTHLARNNLFQYTTCFHEDEVNIAEDVRREDIYCIYEIERSSRSIKRIIANEHYQKDEHTEKFVSLLDNKNGSTIEASRSECYSLDVNEFTPDNIYSNLVKLSKAFIKIKYDVRLGETDRDRLLYQLRMNAYTAFTRFLGSLNHNELKSEIIDHAVKMKIFSEHRKTSLSHSLFGTHTKTQGLLLDSIKSKSPANSVTHFPTRVIL